MLDLYEFLWAQASIAHSACRSALTSASDSFGGPQWRLDGEAVSRFRGSANYCLNRKSAKSYSVSVSDPPGTPLPASSARRPHPRRPASRGRARRAPPSAGPPTLPPGGRRSRTGADEKIIQILVPLTLTNRERPVVKAIRLHCHNLFPMLRFQQI